MMGLSDPCTLTSQIQTKQQLRSFGGTWCLDPAKEIKFPAGPTGISRVRNRNFMGQSSWFKGFISRTLPGTYDVTFQGTTGHREISHSW